jgi:hypothetical protein
MAALIGHAGDTVMTSVAWTNTGGGDWDTAANWSSNPNLPGSSDSVTINTAAAATITHAQNQADAIASLSVGTKDLVSVTAGSLTVAGVATLSGGLTLSGGGLSLNGTSTTTTLNQSGLSVLSGTGTLTATAGANFSTPAPGGGADGIYETGTGVTLLQGVSTFNGVNNNGNYFYDFNLDGGRTLENAGVFDWYGGTFYLGYSLGGATIDNAAGATFDIQCDSAVYNATGPNAFVNAGLLEKTTTGGTTNIATGLTNTGSISVQTGTLQVDGTYAQSGAGATQVASGAALALYGGGTLNASAFIDAAGGTLGFYGGTYNVTGGAALSGTVGLSNATLNLIGSQTIGVLNQATEGVLTGSGTLTVTGGANFNTPAPGGGADGIYETGTGVTLLQGVSTFNGVNSNGNYFYDFNLDGGRVLDNTGVFDWYGGTFYLGYSLGGGAIENAAGAMFDIQCDSVVYSAAGPNAFVNAGLLEKTTTAGTTYIESTFTNTGTVLVQTGTLRVDGAYAQSGAGAAQVAAGATLALYGGATLNASAFTVASGGTLGLYGGTYNVTGGAALAGAVGLSNATLNLSGSQTIGVLNQASEGVLTGTGTLTVTAGGNFNTPAPGGGADGIYETGSGTTLLQGTSTFNGVNGNGNPAYDFNLDGGRTLENAGTFDWNSGSFFLGYNLGGGAIQNAAGATFDIQCDSAIYAGSGTDTVSNAGLFEKSGSGGATSIQTSLSNTGTVDVQTGTLAVYGAFTQGGTAIAEVASGATLALYGGGSAGASAFAVAAGGTLGFDGGTFSLGSGPALGGAVNISDATVNLGGSQTIGAFSQGYQGALAGTGTLTVTGSATFNTPAPGGGADGISETGAGTTVLQGVSTFNGVNDNGNTAYDFNLDGGRTLENTGTFDWQGGSFYLGYSAVGGTLDNAAGTTFNIESDSAVYSGVGTDTVINAGTLVKSVTTGVTTIYASVVNSGALDVETGTLVIDGTLTNTGTITVSAGATLDIEGGGSSPLPNIVVDQGGALNFGGKPFDVALTAGVDIVTETGVTVSAAAGTLSSGDIIAPGAGGNVLQLVGGGAFNLGAPQTLTNINTVNATEGAGTSLPTVTLRSGLNVTVNLATSSGKGFGAKVTGANDASIINLGAGTDTVTLGSAAETVNGGPGADTYVVTASTIGAKISGGVGQGTLDVNGGGTIAMGSNITGVQTVKLGSATTFTASNLNLTIDGSKSADTIAAGSGKDIITGGGGADTLIAGSGSDTFADLAKNLALDTIQGFGVNDVIDITNLKYTGFSVTWSSGVLDINDGLSSFSIKLPGSFSGTFTAVSDGAKGTDIYAPGGGAAALAQAMAALAPTSASPSLYAAPEATRLPSLVASPHA